MYMAKKKEKEEEKTGGNISLILTEEEVKMLDKIKIQLNELASTKTIKRLFAVYFRYVEQKKEIDELKREITRLKNEKNTAEREIQTLKGKIAVFFNAFQDLEKLIKI